MQSFGSWWIGVEVCSNADRLPQPLQLPPIPVCPLHERICLGHVRDFHVLAIPGEPLVREFLREGAGEHRFRERAAVAKVGAALAAFQNGIHPVVVVVL